MSDTINKSWTRLSLSAYALRRSLNYSIKTAALQIELKTENLNMPQVSVIPRIHPEVLGFSLGSIYLWQIPRFFVGGGCTGRIRMKIWCRPGDLFSLSQALWVIWYDGERVSLSALNRLTGLPRHMGLKKGERWEIKVLRWLGGAVSLQTANPRYWPLFAFPPLAT